MKILATCLFILTLITGCNETESDPLEVLKAQVERGEPTGSTTGNYGYYQNVCTTNSDKWAQLVSYCKGRSQGAADECLLILNLEENKSRNACSVQ